MNPYKGKKIWVHAKSGNEMGDAARPYFKRSGDLGFAQSSLSDSTGEMNASSKKDLMAAIGSLQKAVNSGAYVQQPVNQVEFARRRQELVTAAVNDKDGEAWKALGEVIGDEVFETMGRDAFAAKTLLHKPLGKGEIGRIRIRKKDVICYFATRNPEVVASQVRQFYVYPPEYYLVGRVLIEDAEIRNAA